MKKYLPSVKLDSDKCIGCTDCIKRCPTEAIRVRQGKAFIIHEKCIDCGMCIRVCRNHAKIAATDSLEKINAYKIKIAIPAPTLYTQFKEAIDINCILTGLKRIGFDDVFEVSKGAEIITKETIRKLKQENLPKPVLSSACPAVVRLIQIRFPSLISHVLPLISPMEIMARLCKQHYVQQGVPEKEIGVFFISPCAAKVSNVRNPETIESSSVDGVISIRDIYLRLLPILKQLDNPEPLRHSTYEGICWAENGGEGSSLKIDNYIAVDGMDNVIQVLEKVENGELEEIDFIEGLACTGGCLGGPLTVQNPFVAKNTMAKVLKQTKDSPSRKINLDMVDMNLHWAEHIAPNSVLSLDDDINKAFEKMERIQDIYAKLPQIDCGSCGAPTCRALAEDIVQEQANIEDCIFMLRQKVREMAQEMVKLSQKLPPSIGDKNKNKEN